MLSEGTSLSEGGGSVSVGVCVSVGATVGAVEVELDSSASAMLSDGMSF